MKSVWCFSLFIFLFHHSFSQGTWVQKATVFSAGRGGVAGFSIGNKGYFGTGWQWTNNLFYDDFWEWDKTTNAWTQRASFPGAPRGDAVGFSIGAKGYIGIGKNNSSNVTNDFYEWDQASNTWSARASFPGTARAFAVGFSIGSKGYLGTGSNGSTPVSDFWEYDPAANAWTQKANFGGGAVSYCTGFSIGAKGYVGTGSGPSGYRNDFWEYDPVADTWTQRANFPGTPRAAAAGFSIGTKGYIGTGSNGPGTVFDDFYEWDQATNTWTQKASYPHPASDIDDASFSIGCHGYFGCGADDISSAGQYFNDFWEYTPDNLPPVPATVTPNAIICSGDSLVLTAGGGTGYLWNTGSTNTAVAVSPSSTSTYSVAVSTDCGSKTVSTTVVVIQNSNAFFSYEYVPCKSGCVQFKDASAGAYSWLWDMGDGGNFTGRNPCREYGYTSTFSVSLIINNNMSCADTFSVPVPYEVHDTTAFVYIPNAFSPNGDGENDSLRFYIQDDFCLDEFKIMIYGRWGEKIFEADGTGNSWDGTFNGKKLEPDVFAYHCKIITVTGKIISRKGNVSLVR